MNTGFITPIQLMKINPVIQTNVENTENNIQNNNFGNIFRNLYQESKKAENDLMEKQYLLATGQIDDAHQVPIAAVKAELATSMLVQVRNKALEGYNELMRINL